MKRHGRTIPCLAELNRLGVLIRCVAKCCDERLERLGFLVDEHELGITDQEYDPLARQKPLHVDRLVHHAELLALKGDSYRLKDRDLARQAPAE